jgi:hypothetical protein
VDGRTPPIGGPAGLAVSQRPDKELAGILAGMRFAKPRALGYPRRTMQRTVAILLAGLALFAPASTWAQSANDPFQSAPGPAAAPKPPPIAHSSKSVRPDHLDAASVSSCGTTATSAHRKGVDYLESAGSKPRETPEARADYAAAVSCWKVGGSLGSADSAAALAYGYLRGDYYLAPDQSLARQWACRAIQFGYDDNNIYTIPEIASNSCKFFDDVV